MFVGKLLFWDKIKGSVEAAKLEQYRDPHPSNKSCILRAFGTWTVSSTELWIQAEYFLLAHHSLDTHSLC